MEHTCYLWVSCDRPVFLNFNEVFADKTLKRHGYADVSG